MHQTRAETTKKLPIKRKGTKYVVRARSNVRNSVPVLIAIRDMLHLAQTAKEVTEMLKLKLLKINGRQVEDYHETVLLFNILEAHKPYILTLTQNGRFVFEPAKDSTERLCKIIGKKLVKGNRIQFNLHDGTNILSDDKKLLINDSLYLDKDCKIKKHIGFSKGAKIKVLAGKYLGQDGELNNINEKTVLVKLNDKTAELKKSAVVLTRQDLLTTTNLERAQETEARTKRGFLT